MQKVDNKNNTLLAYLMISGIGFLGVIFALTFNQANFVAEKANDALPYTDWAILALAPNKAAMIGSYLIGAALLFVYVIAAAAINFRFRSCMRPNMQKYLNTPWLMGVVLILNIGLLVLFYATASAKLVTVLYVAWFFLLLFPVVSYYLPIKKIDNVAGKLLNLRSLYFAMMIVGYAILVAAMSPYFELSSMQVINDYLWVPEQTYLSIGVVDNNRFIMQSGLGGLYNENLIKSERDLNLDKYHYIFVTDQDKARLLVNNKYNYDMPSALPVMFIKTEKLTGGDKDAFCSISNDLNCASMRVYRHSVKQVSDTSDQLTDEFIKNNKYELSAQILAGHFFHHQYAMLGPVNELLLGKSPSHVTYLYGYGNAHMLSYIFSHIWPTVSFEKFIFTLYSLYLLYFAVFIACCYIFFRDIRTTSLVIISVIGLYLAMGFELIRVAPGFNPIRHFSDLFMLMAFYGYVYARRYNLLYLLVAIVICMFAVYASLEFGLMMTVSLIAAAAIYIVLSSKRYLHLLLLVVAVGALILNIYVQNISTTQNPMSLYSVLGVSVAPTKRVILMMLLLMVLAGYASLLFISIKRGLSYKPIYIATLLFFYSQCLWAYYAWYTEKGHLLSTSPIWFLFFVVLGIEFSSILIKENNKKRIAMLVSGCVAMTVLIAGSVNYFSQSLQYRSIFKTHVVYQWNFPRAHFQSTMNPTVFKEAVALIEEYSHENAIFIISKYDNLLPFLAGKYSAMPFVELTTSLVTEYEVNASVVAIQKAQPRYIFVDSDILSTNFGDVLDPASLFRRSVDKQLLSAGRVSVLGESKRVFKQISANYKLIKSGYLVSVYEHI